jgi:hypothetical protein
MYYLRSTFKIKLFRRSAATAAGVGLASTNGKAVAAYAYFDRIAVRSRFINKRVEMRFFALTATTDDSLQALAAPVIQV